MAHSPSEITSPTPFSPFSSYAESLGSELATSDDAADLGAFANVFREFTELHHPQPVLTVPRAIDATPSSSVFALPSDYESDAARPDRPRERHPPPSELSAGSMGTSRGLLSHLSLTAQPGFEDLSRPQLNQLRVPSTNASITPYDSISMATPSGFEDAHRAALAPFRLPSAASLTPFDSASVAPHRRFSPSQSTEDLAVSVSDMPTASTSRVSYFPASQSDFNVVVSETEEPDPDADDVDLEVEIADVEGSADDDGDGLSPAEDPSDISPPSSDDDDDEDDDMEGVPPVEQPSLGYLDATLSFLAAERERLAAQRTTGMRIASAPGPGGAATHQYGSSTSDSAWRHIVGPRRKRRRKRVRGLLEFNVEADGLNPEGDGDTYLSPGIPGLADGDESSSSMDALTSPDAADLPTPFLTSKSTPGTPPRTRRERRQQQQERRALIQTQIREQQQQQQADGYSGSKPGGSARADEIAAPTDTAAQGDSAAGLVPLPADPRTLRLRTLAHKLRLLFPEDAVRLSAVLARTAPEGGAARGHRTDDNVAGELDLRGPIPSPGDPLVHVFIDHSNILFGLVNSNRRRYPSSSKDNTKENSKDTTGGSGTGGGTSRSTGGALRRQMSHAALALVLERGRPITRRVLAASSPLYQSLDSAQRLGYEVRVFARVPDTGDGADRIARASMDGARRRRPSGSSGTGKGTVEAGRRHSHTQAQPVTLGGNGTSTESDTGVGSGGSKGRGRTGAGGATSTSTSTTSPARLVRTKQYQHRQTKSFSGVTSLQGEAASLPTTSSLHVALGTPVTAAVGTGSAPANGAVAGASGRVKYREQGVDELLQLKIHQAIAAADGPGAQGPGTGATIVLATGDGNVGQFNEEGFLGCVRTALRKGWRVELYAWEDGLSRSWRREFGEMMGGGSEKEGKGRFMIVGLEQFAPDLLEMEEVV